jgi:putative copper export protein
MGAFVLRGLLFFVIGLVFGIGHARSIAEGERLHRESGERARPVVLHAFRLLLLCVGFGVVFRAGPLPLAASFAGFFLARPLWAWWYSRRKRS